ncbi:MAG: MGDG synthase family glycosyltransferase [Acetivibrionales bacterium]|jgi:processive 1,2-diacylglycerol beta-glucosyltransferase
MYILILTAATGGGHAKAASALKEYMEKHISGCRVDIVDALKYISPLVEKVITGTYLKAIRNVPGVYGRLYDLSEKDESISGMVKGFNGVLAHGLYSLFERDKPDVVICTHTVPLHMVSRMKQKGLLDAPVIGIVTDYTNHYFWKLDEIDALVVAHDCIKEDMVRIGIREEIIHTCGIPVCERFTSDPQPDRKYLLKKTGLDYKPTILVMGGSLGFSGMCGIFSSLLELERDIQVIAVTGHNKKLKDRLDSISRGSRKKTKIFGYTDNISDLMGASDLIITKPGGITVSEALVRKLPLIIVTPIPGQEERNARFLANSEAAFLLSPSDDMETVLRRTLDRPGVLRKMSEAADRLAKPRACEDIMALVKTLVKTEPEVLCVSRSFR